MSVNMTIIVPLYKNEATIYPFCSELVSVTNVLEHAGVSCEVIFVNDGSPDKTKDKLIAIRRDFSASNWRIVNLSRNFGQLNAILAGLELATGEYNVSISADLQDPPKLMIQMFQKAQLGNDVVLGARESRGDNYLTRITSKIAYKLLRREVPEIPKGGFDYFLISKQVKDHLLNLKGRFRFIQGDIVSLGFDLCVIRYDRGQRIAGKSSYTFTKRLKIFIDSFVDVSYAPIRFVTGFGFAVALCGFVVSVLSIFNYFFGVVAFRGFTAIFNALLLIGGAQLIGLGFVGEYAYRIYDMNRARQVYIIKSVE